MTTVTQQNDPRAEYIKGLRALADALENNPELPLPKNREITFNFLGESDAREQMAAIRRALGIEFTKKTWEKYFDLNGNLHGLPIELAAFRSDVCERVVIGTRKVEIEEPDPQALAAVPKVKRVQVVEDVEWRCHPILAAEHAQAVTR